MSDQNYTASFTVDQSPEEVFAAITNVRAWWSEEITGSAEKAGDEFVFAIPGVHYSRIRLSEVVPHQKIVWHVVDASIEFVEDKTEWTGTDIVFEIQPKGEQTKVRFTHVGLVPEVECFNLCTGGWNLYFSGSLHALISTGTGNPNRASGTFDSEVAKAATA